jgi:hypothetical protein
MTSLNKPVSTLCLAVASAFVLAPPAHAETPTQLGAIDVQGAADASPIPRPRRHPAPRPIRP